MTSNSEEAAFTVFWKIENFSYFTQEENERLSSPYFFMDVMDKSSWCLTLCPFKRKSMCCSLQRTSNSYETFKIDYELAFLASDGSALSLIKTNATMSRCDGICPDSLNELREEVLGTRKELYLPCDTLTVRCRIWKSGTDPSKIVTCYVRTQIEVEIISFLWNIKAYSALQGNKERFCHLKPVSENIPPLTFRICLVGGEDKLKIESSSLRRRSLTYNIAIENTDGDETDFSSSGDQKLYCSKGKPISLISPLISRKQLLSNKNLYLVDDVLALKCKVLISCGDEVSQMVSAHYGLPPNEIDTCMMDRVNKNSNPCQMHSSVKSLLDDMLNLYDEEFFSDVTLSLEDMDFPVHKCILAARSPVFKAMFSHETKEKQTGIVKISDVDDDTLSNLLVYCYTNRLDDLDVDEACKLYFAADKYEILTLKQGCSSFLKSNLSVSNACDVLVLSEIHGDNDVKSIVLDYILANDSKVIESNEWKEFAKDNLQLAFETLQLMYQKKNRL